MFKILLLQGPLAAGSAVGGQRSQWDTSAITDAVTGLDQLQLPTELAVE